MQLAKRAERRVEAEKSLEVAEEKGMYIFSRSYKIGKSTNNAYTKCYFGSQRAY